MKRVARLPEPQQLTDYRTQCPESTWKELCEDPLDGGMSAHRAIKRTTLAQQRCLCAFCEQRIYNEVPDLSINHNIASIRTEHFHPKSDKSTDTNWHLIWENLWAVCDGGDNWPPMALADPRQRVEPKHENKSCDAFKNDQVISGKLSQQPEGWLLAPDSIPAFPNLFRFSTKGEIKADADVLAVVIIQGNRLPSTEMLVEATITHLNLNCSRLSRLREAVIEELDIAFFERMESEPDRGPEIMADFASYIFVVDPQKPWPEYFSLYRWYLGDAAEARLQQIGYTG